MHNSASGAAAVGRLMRPHSVAIIGISSKAGSAGQTVLENLKVNDFTGDVHLVGRANEIDGRPVRSSVDELPEGIDLAIFTLPAAGVKDNFDGRAVVMADLFNRGVLDVVVANQNGPLLLYKNTVAPGRDWIQFRLTGTKSNRSAIGAQVRVFWTMKGADRTLEQVKVVSGGNGYASQNMRRLHFGLGEDAQIEKVVIQWPSGQTQTLSAPKLNKLHTIEEPSK